MCACICLGSTGRCDTIRLVLIFGLAVLWSQPRMLRKPNCFHVVIATVWDILVNAKVNKQKVKSCHIEENFLPVVFWGCNPGLK